ncbi:MAG: hypothetical protein HY878_00470, partial [Deltaproteobacteria bacterium]|nr:hypothetical protein [Deltaproteobacteria bacterium]
MKQFFISLLAFVSILLAIAVITFLILIDPSPMGRWEYLYTMGRLETFRFTGWGRLDGRETRLLYENACIRRCHGREVVERSRHTAREWEMIVEKMRLVNKARLTRNEITTITRYLQKNYGSNVPTILSVEANRFLKQYLWRSDFGESDLYVDVIYAPLEYFRLMGGMADAERYRVDKHTVFLVYLNTHQEKLSPFPIERLAILKDASDRKYTPIEWKVTYESGDLHH